MNYSDTGEELDCEIHDPISPTPAFFNQIRLIMAASFRRFGGALRNSKIVVTVGAEEQVELADHVPWSRELGVEWRWLNPAIYARHNYWGTAIERFRQPFESQYVLFLDADVLAIAPPDFATSPVTETGGLAGLITSPPSKSRFRKLDRVDGDGGARQASIRCPAFRLGRDGLDLSGNTRRRTSTWASSSARATRRVPSARGSMRRWRSSTACATRSTGARSRSRSRLCGSASRWNDFLLRLNCPNDLNFWRGHQAEAARVQPTPLSPRGRDQSSGRLRERGRTPVAVARPVENPLTRLLQERIRILLLEPGGDDG